MNHKTYIHQIAFILLTLVSFTSCETLDLDINENPDLLSIDSADPNFILNGIQFNFVTQHIELSETSSGTMRHTHLFGTYAGASTTDVLDTPWANTYAITSNLNLLKEIAQTINLSEQIGIAQVLEAWAYVNLVDYIGTAVYTEAVNADITTPNLDSGESIYNAMYLQLNTAITNLNKGSDITPEDVFYNGEITKWIKLANTLKLKMYIQSKLVATDTTINEINTIIASRNYINDSDDDFVLFFGDSETNPDNRHHWYQNTYVSGAGNQYMSNDFIYKLKDEKGFEDPRLKYYIYRQTKEDPTNSLLPCEGNSDYDYCYLGNGYWARDHGDDAGRPNDSDQKSTFGIYPAGGAFDDNISNTSTIATNNNLAGAGIHPIWLSSFSKFMLAEAALPSPSGLGTSGTSFDYLIDAIQDSFTKVSNLSTINMDTSETAEYINYVTDEYNAASETEKLNIIMREYYIAMWGNSIEAYNNYRRTGMPTLQTSVITTTDFPRSYFIPESELNANDNPNLTQKTLTDQVFWDTNPAGFIK